MPTLDPPGPGNAIANFLANLLPALLEQVLRASGEALEVRERPDIGCDEISRLVLEGLEEQFR